MPRTEIKSLITILAFATECNCWSNYPLQRQTENSANHHFYPHRRKFLQSLLLIVPSVASSNIKPASASNLPSSTGADDSKTGTVESLMGIVSLRYSLSRLEKSHNQKKTISLDGVAIPASEQSFKRIFDSYSDRVSYKQKFMDQNAFLVGGLFCHYTTNTCWLDCSVGFNWNDDSEAQISAILCLISWVPRGTEFFIIDLFLSISLARSYKKGILYKGLWWSR